MEAERMISPFSKLLENGLESEKTINTKKFRIFCSFSMVYYLPHSDKVCRNYGETKVYYLPHSDEIIGIIIIYRFMHIIIFLQSNGHSFNKFLDIDIMSKVFIAILSMTEFSDLLRVKSYFSIKEET